LIGIALHEFGDHFVIAAPKRPFRAIPGKVSSGFPPELRQKQAGALACEFTLHQDRGSLHEADFLF
jgi:hypothetical protein